MPSIAAIQMITGPCVEENFRRATQLLAQAAEAGADIAVFPETFLTYGSPHKPDEAAQREVLQGLARMAQQHGVWLVAGTLPLNNACLHLSNAHVPKADRPFAASAVFDSSGQRMGEYLKMHLFDVDVNDSTQSYRESNDYAAGDEIKVFATPWGGLGVAICYDLRFPELFVSMAQAGATIIAVPSAFTHTTGEAHWQVLLRARAIETQSYIVAANQGGRHFNGRETWGESMIVNPWGEVVSKLVKGEGIIVQALDLARLQEIRAKMPMAQHRRIALGRVNS